MTSTSVSIPKNVYNDISSWALKAFPNEGYALLIGRFKGNLKEVVRFVGLENRLLKKTFSDIAAMDIAINDPRAIAVQEARLSTLPAERLSMPEKAFALDPAEYNREVLKAEKEGLDVVGIMHTHPNHPPKPSKIDSSQPFLAQWSNIIVAVHYENTPIQMKSWFRETDDQEFDEEKISIGS